MTNLILEKLEVVNRRFLDITREINNPEVVSDMKRYVRLSKEHKSLKPVVAAYSDYRNVVSNIESAKEILSQDKDDEMKEMAKSEIEELTARKAELEEKIKLLLIPADPEDEKDAVLEIRAGTGGDEASIFAGDLTSM